MTWYSRHLENSGCTYWDTSGTDDFGNPNWTSPQILDCRWQDKQELFRDKEGNESVSKAIVYLNSDVNLTGYLYHGTSSGSDPTSTSGAYEIRGFEKVTDIKFNINLRKVWL